VAEWTTWPHAYGPATDTPGHLRALESGDEEVKRAAAFHFRSAIVHQSTIWPPSPDAFAGLIRVLRTSPLPDDVLTDCLLALADAGEHVPEATTVGDLTPAGRAWLAKFVTTEEDDHDLLWEEFLGSPIETDVYDWVLARMAALRPEVAALVTDLAQRNPEGLDEVRATWLTRPDPSR
jgi:hypothetical protein